MAKISFLKSQKIELRRYWLGCLVEFASGSTIKYLFYTIQNMNFNTRENNIFKGLILTELDLIVLRKLSQATNQKSLSQDIGISVGKVNYIINALVDKGFVKATRFVNSKNKIQEPLANSNHCKQLISSHSNF